MKVWRLQRRRFTPTASAAYGGDGAAQRGGRWNSRGVRVAYGASSRALALVELLAHLDWGDLPDDLVLVGASLPGPPLPPPPLPDGWDADPPTSASAAIGDGFVREGAALALAVPSVVVAGEDNVLVNPAHRDFRRIAFDAPVPFLVDPRLRARSPGR